MSSHEPAGRLDARAVVLAGATTFAWYAVPDVLARRWARALAKTGVAVTGAALAVGVTRGGAQVRADVRAIRDEAGRDADARTVPGVPVAVPDLDAAQDHTGSGDHVDLGAHTDSGDCPACSDNPAPLDAPTDTVALVAPRPGVAVAVGLGAAALAAVACVAAERWVHRRAEALRARGVRRPHVLVGAILGVVGAGMAAIDVPPGPADHDAVSSSAAPRRGAGSPGTR
ncbi:hypothetical protein ACNHYB_09545 [Isoptericola jiangsuensis]|uniref:hypothetical protein n=1 Tax=Isoptericola jiangsuensis TaxID=548579 RepID=UPI003AABA525